MSDPIKPRMMPGQEPYTEDELRKLYKLIREAAKDDPGEDGEQWIRGS